jgi:hypothetical protein
MFHRGIRLSESTAGLVRASESAANDATLTERAALEYVRALNEATHAMDPASKIVANKNIANENIEERK